MSKHTEVNTGHFTVLNYTCPPKRLLPRIKKILFFHLGVGHLELQREHMVPPSFILGYFSVSVNGAIHPPLDPQAQTGSPPHFFSSDTSSTAPESTPPLPPPNCLSWSLDTGYYFCLLTICSLALQCVLIQKQKHPLHTLLLLSLILRIKRKLLTKTSKGICSLQASSTSLLQLLWLRRAPSFHLPP